VAKVKTRILNINVGPFYTSGSLEVDELSTLMCMEELGGAMGFIDPLSVYRHQVDIDLLLQLTNVQNIRVVLNSASACAMCPLFIGKTGFHFTFIS